MNSVVFIKKCRTIWRNKVGNIDVEKLKSTLQQTVDDIERSGRQELYPRLVSFFADKIWALTDKAIDFAAQTNYNSRLDDMRSMVRYFTKRYLINKDLSEKIGLNLSTSALLNISESETRQHDHADNYPYLTVDKGIADKAEKIEESSMWKSKIAKKVKNVYLYYTEPPVGYYKKGNYWIKVVRDTKVILDKCRKNGAINAFVNNIIVDKLEIVTAYAESIGYNVLPLLGDAAEYINLLGDSDDNCFVYLNGGGYNSINQAVQVKSHLPNSIILVVHSKNGRQRNTKARKRYAKDIGVNARDVVHYNDECIVDAIKESIPYDVESIKYKNGWLLVVI